MTDVIHADFMNNIYCRTAYDSVIYFPDTSFHHTEYFHLNANWAISKYNSRGKFLNALNLYTVSGENLHYPLLVTDDSLNIYLSLPFPKQIFINDTVINAAPTPWPSQPDVLIAKLSPDYHLVWSKLISSIVQDDVRGMAMSDDNYLYTICVHYANGEPEQVNYLGQETSMAYTTPMNSLTKLDLNGTLIWNREIRSEFLGTSVVDLSIEYNGRIYVFGNAYGDVSIGSDTIYHPFSPSFEQARFVVIFSPSGELVDGYFFGWDIWEWETKSNSIGDIFVSGSISDTAVIGTDTIIVPEGENHGFVGRFNSSLIPIWYHEFEDGVSFRIIPDGENLLFVTSALGTLQIVDTVLSLGTFREVVAGEFDTQGQVIKLISTNSSKEIGVIFSVIDHSKNLVIGGRFTGSAIFGNDTVSSNSGIAADGFVAKIIHEALPVIELVVDSVACKGDLIYGPEGYTYYKWNDQLTNQNFYPVNETGTYHFACRNENEYWLYDSVSVKVYPMIEPELGQDIFMNVRDSLVFSCDEPYQSYLWSDGSTLDYITIVGSEYGPGTYPLWVEVSDGNCLATDTLLLTVLAETGVHENFVLSLEVFPNPFSDLLTVKILPEFQVIEIYDLTGCMVYSKELSQLDQTWEQIESGNLKKGIYAVKIITKDRILRKKVVRI